MSTNLVELGWVAFAAAAAAAASAAMAAAVTAHSLVYLPAENREYLDAPPRAFRALWLPVRALAPLVSRFIPTIVRSKLSDLLLLAGLDFALSVDQFLAFQCLLALGCALLGVFVATTWHASAAAAILLGGAVGFALPLMWARDRVRARRRATQKTLPFILDLITLCVEAGLTLQSAFAHTVAKGPHGPLRDEISRVLRDHRAGKTRIEALRQMARRMNDAAVVNLTTALIQAETLGMNLGPILRAQAEQRRAERYVRAEKLAMEAPVKMLFPLVAFIFPCTFIVLGFPIAIKFMHSGL